ncbi:transcriptional regulator ATRX homolog [Wyeomyia smithii]|uniref:transcriptional regulator ATRX homolog n=1 Tax=Wyeomyia smithii TaxID=174621 RepID=UPI002467F18A|nr:transcriptional regulator ATRX homolog [Wyeomyia smithii]
MAVDKSPEVSAGLLNTVLEGLISSENKHTLCETYNQCSNIAHVDPLLAMDVPSTTTTTPNDHPSRDINSRTQKESSSFDSAISDEIISTEPCMFLNMTKDVTENSQADSVINDDIFAPQSCDIRRRNTSTQLINRCATDESSQTLETNDTGHVSLSKIPKSQPEEYRSAGVTSLCENLQSKKLDDSKTEIKYYNQFMASSSKIVDAKLGTISVDSKFVTHFDPNPNRKPTPDEIQYSVPHIPRFSVQTHNKTENLELTLMKREIEMRLRANDLSWVTQRAIREESSRVKKVCQNSQDLEQQLLRYGTKLTLNQLILDYDKEKKTFIRVHPELVAKMKPHQKEGVKFMYECCYGSVSDSKLSKGSGCILAHCMGLGKTLQVIALINTVISYPQTNTKRIIVVCPKSTVMNWDQEFRDWLEDVDCSVHLHVSYFPDSSNIDKKMEVLKRFHDVSGKNASCLLIGYEAYRSLIFYDAKNKHGERQSDRIRAEVRRYLINPGADVIILDEGHMIKNRKSMTNLAIAEVATKRRIILTGTPIQNNLKEYFCMVSFVKPAYLGSEREFNEHYARPIIAGQHKDSNPGEIKLMKMKSYILHKHLMAFVHRKEFSVLKDFLPKKYDYVIYVPLTPVQEDLYEEYLRRNPFRRDVGGLNLLEDYTFLRKIWTHPIVLERAWENAMKRKYGVIPKKRIVRGFDSSSEDEDASDDDNTRCITNAWWKQFISADDLESIFPSNKMLLLFEILKMCQERGEKCLIFSGFVMVLNMVEHFMKKIDEQATNPKAALHGLTNFRGPWRPEIDYYRIDGGTAKSTRHEMVTKFNDLNNRVTRVFLISTKAGGQGINLVGANRVVILDTSWNPAVDQQGIFRIYRLGQTKTCYIYRLLAIHTMEEKVYSRAVTKEATSHRVADKKQVDRNYSMAELEELYHFERVDMAARENPSPAEDDLLSVLLWKHHKLIYRYHTHEIMLDNKTEKDLTELEKKLAWLEFKKKGLTNSLEMGLFGVSYSQIDSQFESGADSQLIFSTNEDYHNLNSSDELSNEEVSTQEESSIFVKRLDLDENASSIFGEDPYEVSSVRSTSIIAEERMKFKSKIREPSRIIVTVAEVELLRELEENKLRTENITKQRATDVVAKDTARPLDSKVSRNVSHAEENSTALEKPIMDVSSRDYETDTTLCSLIEYDPIGDTGELKSVPAIDSKDTSVVEPTSYEIFEADILKGSSVATSTAKAQPVVVEVVSSSPFLGREPIMTRAMRRRTAEAEPTGLRRSKRNRKC